MPTTEFLPRPDVLHADETSEQRNASFERYREWMELSPQTRMEIAGTSKDPKILLLSYQGGWRVEMGTESQDGGNGSGSIGSEGRRGKA